MSVLWGLAAAMTSSIYAGWHMKQALFGKHEMARASAVYSQNALMEY